MAPPCKEAADQPSFFLPDELIEDIFARMPASSAQRCRCLSRAWAAALSSRSFIDRHLRLANRRDGSRSRSVFFLPDYHSMIAHTWSPSRPLVAVSRDIAVVTRQCRGLVVLMQLYENYYNGPGSAVRLAKYYVCNPSTGQMTALPKGKDAFGLWPLNHDSLGIGYDASIQKHKVVRLYCRGALPPACEVYVLNSTTKHWRPPAGAPDKVMPPGFATDFCSDQSVFAHGYLYWGAQPDRNSYGERVIISFSIRDEVFDILPPPPAVRRLYPCEITELDQRLCLFNNTDNKRVFDIWVLHDHRAGTWGIHCRIDLDREPLAGRRLICSYRVFPLDIADDGRNILLRPGPHDIPQDDSDAHQLYVYRPATGGVESLLVDGGIISHHTMARRVAVPYEESIEPTG
nr:F-box protein DOR-like [Lolium perenne]